MEYSLWAKSEPIVFMKIMFNILILITSCLCGFSCGEVHSCFYDSLVSTGNIKLHNQQLRTKVCSSLQVTTTPPPPMNEPSTAPPSSELLSTLSTDLITELDPGSNITKRDAELLPTCQVFKYATKPSLKVKYNSTWTANFSCVTNESLCNKTVEINGTSGKLYCCTGDQCNNLLFLKHSSGAEFVKVKTCFTSDSKGKSITPCHESSMCINITTEGSPTSYQCANEVSEQRLCSQNGTFGEGCYQINNSPTSCCCASDNCNFDGSFVTPLAPVNVHSTPISSKPKTKEAGGGSAVIPILIAILSVLVLFMFVVYFVKTRKCRKQPRGLSVMDFGYSRIQADAYDEEY